MSDKASTKVPADATVELISRAKFVSRGGDKLDNAIADLQPRLDELKLSIQGAQAIDVGASTGGFTDCLLQRGAAHVLAVDVGYGQLHERLRQDPRVTVMERTNARHLQSTDLPYRPQMIVCDVSFISLSTVLPGPLSCMQAGFWGLLLCKPQFEAGRERMRTSGSRGVVRDAGLRSQIVDETVEGLERLSVHVDEVVRAHPPGPKGNVEYVLLIRDNSS